LQTIYNLTKQARQAFIVQKFFRGADEKRRKPLQYFELLDSREIDLRRQEEKKLQSPS
jgi:hypothetical protein